MCRNSFFRKQKVSLSAKLTSQMEKKTVSNLGRGGGDGLESSRKPSIRICGWTLSLSPHGDRRGRRACRRGGVAAVPNLGRFPGEIRWQGDGYVGIAFSEMAIAIEDRLRSRAPPAAEARSSMPDLDVPVIRFENARKGDRTAEHINKRQ